MGIKNSMMSWAKRKQVPSSDRSTFAMRNNMRPINSPCFSTDKTERSFVVFSPKFQVTSGLIGVFIRPFFVSSLNSSRVSFYPFSLPSIGFKAMLILILSLPLVTLAFFIASFTQAKSFVGNIIPATIVTLSEIIFFRPHKKYNSTFKGNSKYKI